MVRLLFIILIIEILMPGCRKQDNPKLSGTDTINNKLYGTGPYFPYGFSFSKGKIVSALDNPGPDITVYADRNIDGSIKEISFDTSNYEDSFSLIGEYDAETTAIQIFSDLITIGNIQWSARAIPLKNNQVWVYRNSDLYYVKLRIINTVKEIRQDLPYAECTFEWAILKID
jgi:hypothetical protein